MAKNYLVRNQMTSFGATTWKYICLGGLNSLLGIRISTALLSCKNIVNQIGSYIWDMDQYLQLVFVLLPRSTYTHAAGITNFCIAIANKIL